MAGEPVPGLIQALHPQQLDYTVPKMTTGSLHERWGFQPRSLRSRRPSPQTEHGKILALGRTAKTMAGKQGKKSEDERGQAGTRVDDSAWYFP